MVPVWGGGYQRLAEPQHPHMATLVRAMKKNLGYAAVKWPEGRDDLTVGGMLLQGLRIGFCLCGARERWCSDWILEDYGLTATVQCGSGWWATGYQPCWWATGYQPCAPNLHFDLSAWTFYEIKGSMPYPQAPPENNVKSFKNLAEVFEAVWIAVQQDSQPVSSDHKMVALYCKSWPASVLCAPNHIPDAELSHP